MVAIDPSKDYYAALEVGPNCDEEEIKKQYRKLALLYHPDRNAGKEAEYAPRFQIIQEAYEVLMDPELREKYNQKRSKRTPAFYPGGTQARRPGPTGRTNPAYQTTSNFPPPPRRTGPARTTTDFPPNAHANGANRYSQWAGPPPPRPRAHPPTSKNKESEERKNIFNAWQEMNHGPAKQPPPQVPSPQLRRHNVPPPYTASQQRPVPTPPETPGSRPTSSRHNRAASTDHQSHSAYEEVKGSDFGRPVSSQIPKRPGLNPRGAGLGGWEPPARGPSVYRTATGGFGATNIFQATDAAHSSSSAQTSEPQKPQDQQSGDDVPFTEGEPKPKTPYPANVGERTNIGEGTNYFDIRRASSVQDASKLFPQEVPDFQRRKSDTSQASQVSDQQAPSRPPKTATFDLDDDNSPSPSRDRSSDEELGAQKASAEGTSSGTGLNGIPSNTTESSEGRQLQPNLGQRRNRPQVKFDRFPRTKEPAYRSSNPDLRSPNQEPQEFSASQDTQSSLPSSPPKGMPARSSSHPNMSRIGSEEIYSEDEEVGPVGPPPEQGPKSAGAEPSQTPDSTAFRADQWEKDLQSNNWASKWAHLPNGQTSPTKGKSSSKRSRVGTRHTNRAFPGTWDGRTSPLDCEEEGKPPSAGAHDDFDDIDPMDIDTEPPNDTRRPSIMVSDTTGPPPQARPVHVEPSRPEWRDRTTDGNNPVSADRRSSVPDASFFKNTDFGTQVRPVSQTEPARAPIDMSHFQQVYPFKKPGPTETSPNAGFDNLKGDLVGELPFPSQPSTRGPDANRRRSPTFEDLPKPPKPPVIDNSISSMQCGALYNYCCEYHQFTNHMLALLQNLSIQQSQFTADASASSQNPNPSSTMLSQMQPLGPQHIMPMWLSAQGDTNARRGWNSYLQIVKDQAKLRKHLEVGSEKFYQIMAQHDANRRRAMNSAVPNHGAVPSQGAGLGPGALPRPHTGAASSPVFGPNAGAEMLSGSSFRNTTRPRPTVRYDTVKP